jgi:capsid assembly protease
MSEQDNTAAETPGTWLGYIESHVWALRPQVLAALTKLAVEGRLEAGLSEQETSRLEAARRTGRPPAIRGGVATVALKGVLAPPHPILAMLFGLRNPVDDFVEAVAEAAGNDDIGAVVLDIDSPGGVVDNIPEAAAGLRALRSKGKPIVAVSNTMAASAAYWLASQADEVVVTPSGAIGSIGVYATHRDMSGAMKLMGVETTLISAGKFKTDGNPYEPLSDSAREHIKENVDHFYNLFTADVAKGRGVKQADVKAGYGEGRVLNAKLALAENLVDRVETLGEAVARLSSRSRGGTATVAEADGPEPNDLGAEAEADAGADTDNSDRDEHREVLEALFIDDPVLASRTLDKYASAAATTT